MNCLNKEVFSEFHSQRLVYNHIKYTEMDHFVIGPQVHDVFEILYLKQGDLTYQVEGKTYHIKKNGLIITRPGAIHIIHINNPKVYERHDFLFENRVVFESILKKLPEEMNVINLNEYPQVIEIFTKMDYYCSHFKGDELKKILADLVEEIMYNLVIVANRFPLSQSNGNYSANPVIAAAIEYIDNNLNSGFGIDDLCQALFVSKSYLHQLFTRHLQISPQKYVNSKRLLMAQKEIRAFAKPTEVFAKCGFSDYSSFYRAYKKFFGYPPSEEHDRKIFRVIDF